MTMEREEATKLLKALNMMLRSPDGEPISDACDALDMAIEALQREIPKNPIVNYVADSDGARRLNSGWTEDSYLCPVCYTYFGTTFDEGYCSKCGQKLIQKRVRVIEP